MKMNLGRRIFLIVFVAITFIFTVLIGFQYYFMEDFYYSQKVNEIERDVNYVIESSNYLTIEQFTESTYLLEEETGLSIQVIPGSIDFFGKYYDEEFKESFPVFFMAEDDDGNVFEVSLEVVDEELLDEVMIGLDIDVVGYLDTFTLFVVELNDHKIYDDTEGDVESFALKVLTQPEIIEMYPIDENERKDVVVLDNEISSYTFDDRVSSDLTIAFEKEVIVDGQNLLLYIETSLQSVREVSSILLPYYILFYVFGIALSLLLSKLLSKQISKPIVMITNKANQMAEMNFDEKIEYHRDDELGELSASINTMSKNLSCTLRELKESNKTLMKEIDKERKIEADRRQFISNVSHELKTPISISRGYLEAIKDRINPKKHDDYLDIIYAENERMNETVSTMLQLLKVDSTENYNLKMLELDNIIHELELHFELELASKNMKLVVDEVGFAMIEERSFKSLMINLISNAIKYGKEGSAITIKHTRTEKLELSITNDVIDDVNTDDIFTRFYTSDESRNRQTSGTGLGLSIVKSILEKYQSNYDVISEHRVFTFRFDLDIK